MPTAKAEAEYKCRALLLSVEAREADGGRRGRWGQGQWGRQATGIMPERTSIEDYESHRAKSLVNSCLT
ncbi:hypothetical protein BDD12DRAFT_891726 [Trichophaea hybrida]|nr:hypothetical protein BDD12DRAFT_891726 [Trichophaea hybrida]